MTFESSNSQSAELKSVDTGVTLPWWTWILPFFIAHLGTRLSLWFKTDPGTSLWYLPTAFGIVMAYWWGPRILLGIYLNAVLSVPLWDLPSQGAFLYALPKTLEIGLSWFLFANLARGKAWLPDLRNVSLFLFLGSLIPTAVANFYLVHQLYLLGDIAWSTIWDNWRILFSADLASQYVFAVPILILFTDQAGKRGWSLMRGKIPRPLILPDQQKSPTDKMILISIFAAVLLLILLFPIRGLWVFHGFLMIFLAVRYGVYIAVIGTSWIGLLVFLFPAILSGRLGSPTSGFGDLLEINLAILLISGVTLVAGRAISDLSAEIDDRRRSEESLRKTEMQYRTLAEQIPPIVYTAEAGQDIGVTYVSPRISMLGFTQEEWIADPDLWFRQIHPEDQIKITKIIEEGKASEQPLKAEYRIRTRDGRELWFLDEAMDVLDRDGKPVFRQGFMLDITSRKQAEELLASRERYLELLNDMTRAILLSDDYDAIMQTLARDMKNIIDADDCYILRWDDENQLAIPVMTTAELDFPFSETALNNNEASIAASILKAGHALVFDDILASPQISRETAQRYPVRSFAGIPLIAGGKKLGVAIIAFNSHHALTGEEIERAEQAGNQVALALLDYLQNQEIQRRLKESNTLAEISRALSETERVGTDKVLQLIVDSARDLIVQADESVIHLLDAEEEILISRAVSGIEAGTKGTDRPKMRLREGVAGRVIDKGKTINIGNIDASPLFVLKDTSPSYRSLLVAPVQSGGHPIGTISVQSGKLDAFSTSDVELLNALSTQAAIAIENTRLFEKTQQSLREVNALYRTSQGLASSLDTDELIEDVVNLLHINFGYYHVQVYFLDPSNNDLVLKSGSGEVGAKLLAKKHRLPGGIGIVGHVVNTGMPFVTNDVNAIVFYFRNQLLPDTMSEMTVPIKVEGKVVGVIDIQDKPPHRLTDNDLQLMAAVGDQLSAALQKASLYENLQNSLQQEQMIRSQLLQSERLAVVGRLLASVSHELNNPLQAIQNALFLLKDEEHLSPQGRQDMEVILAEAERMAALIERLRNAYRPGRIRDFRPIALNVLIEDVHALIGTHTRQKQISIEFHPDPDLALINGLSDQIRQVMLNLLLNSIEVMKPGGRLIVQTRNLPLQNEVLLTVRDTGPGIDPEILPHIFDAFISNKHTGTGLGLTITHDIIQQHNGRIQAGNDPDGGAVFNVWFPMYEENEK